MTDPQYDYLETAHDHVEDARSATTDDTRRRLDTIGEDVAALAGRGDDSPSLDTEERRERVHELEQELSAMQAEEALDATVREHIDEAATFLRRHRQGLK